GVGGERDEGDRQRGEDPDNAYHRMAAENATDPAGRLTDLRTPAGPPRRLPEAGPPAAMARTTALASAFRVLVAAHCCCSALLGMNRGSRRDGLHSVPGMGSILSGEAWACGDIKMQSVGAATLTRLLPAEYGGGSAACRPLLEWGKCPGDPDNPAGGTAMCLPAASPRTILPLARIPISLPGIRPKPPSARSCPTTPWPSASLRSPTRSTCGRARRP